ncbi:histidine--tRNA ligase [Candidatus Phytoplasma australiense]|uniref:Histidine--tRNA ligase n=1 Tax=Strawberry lethal yellows phytoplasma (CPA) str. NZSb11 TaxID=980422 RepID=R4S0B0_PHYAS|nr:histidine--tRNA ligase [Candidatus Phytoplasma australiense]AGL90193.1 Histidyl-tRNA synthetase [Strawberry lethal yellows phytoplasma (CPA) str. NZSb11]
MFYKIKGTHDLLPTQTTSWQKVENSFHSFFKKHQFQEIRTPIMEYAEVFHRAAQHSEMVSKETYTFPDKKNRLITLRPEGTAGIVRSYIENKLDQTNKLQKFYYYGPYFRYERPQFGRYRQFHQLGVEVLGKTTPFLDIEVITLIYQFLKSLGLDDITIQINSLGSKEDHLDYVDIFKQYLKIYSNYLCGLCHERLNKNPLRIWDCKTCHLQDFLKQAPKIFDSLSPKSKKRFQTVLNGLEAMKVNFKTCHDLVRGLDYYTHTVFEITFNKMVLGGGGCYDHLVAALGGNQLSGIGFALGMERLMLTLQENNNFFVSPQPSLKLFLFILDPVFFHHGLTLVHILRNEGFCVEFNYSFTTFTKGLKEALKCLPNYLLILGHQEFAKKQITIKNIKTHTQTTIDQKDLIFYFQQQRV